MTEISYGLCEVCEVEPAVGVAAMPFIPGSFGYGRACLTANAHPYWMLVRNTALIGGLMEGHEAWSEMVADTLVHLAIDPQRFDYDVELDDEEMIRDQVAWVGEHGDDTGQDPP